MVVQHNLTAMNSNRMLGLTTASQAKSTEKLSSGYKINRAADDAAGLSISEKMRKQIRGLTQASANAQDGISAVQTAEGALTEVHDMLQRMNELAVKAANGTNSVDDRQNIQDEIDQLVTEIDRVAETTKFNETYLLKGDKDATKIAKMSYVVTAAPIADAVFGQNDGSGSVSTAPSTYADEVGETKTYTYGTSSGKWNDGDKDIDDLSTLGITYSGVGAEDGDSFTVTYTPAGTMAAYDENGNKVSENGLDAYLNDTMTAYKEGKQLYGADKNPIDISNIEDYVEQEDPATGMGRLDVSLHVGADATTNNQIEMKIDAMDATSLGIKNIKITGKSDTNSLDAIETIKAAIQKVSTQRSSLGAVQNRLEHTINNLDNVVENTTAAESQIRDTDMAKEMVKYSNNNILAQAGQAMLAQANQTNQGVLSLIQ